MSTAQMDCPWCGCGWLIPCSKCFKSFTFAEIKEIDTPLVEIGRREMAAIGIDDIDDDELHQWASYMGEMMDCFEVGDKVVYLDGGYFSVDSENILIRWLFFSS